MRTVNIHQVDAFTDQLFGGNPAGVVTNANILTETEMKKIAREMNLSETAFVLPATDTTADLRLRFFTPNASEIDFCGHATVGALSQLAQLDMFGLGGKGENPITVQTKAETLTMSVTNTAEGTSIAFTAPAVDMQKYTNQQEAAAKRLRIPPEALMPGKDLLIDRNLRYLYIPVASLEVLNTLTLDFDHLRQEFAAENIIVFSLYAKDTSTDVLHSRGLAPLVGIDEDPFTGSMQAGMVVAAKTNNVIPGESSEIHTTQGYSVGRPGYATVMHDQGNIITVKAASKLVFSATMELV